MSTDDTEARDDRVIADRTYVAVFHDVWAAALAAPAALRGWSVGASDSRGGTISLDSADLFGRSPAALELRLSLDDLGLTRLEILAPAGSAADDRRDRRRAGRLLRRVDRLLEAAPRR